MSDFWIDRLGEAIAAALREFASGDTQDEFAVLAIVCLPWHGVLSLALLTAEELAEDARLADPRTTMDWRHGEFTEQVDAWDLSTPLALEMRATYDASSDRPATARAFLHACARAVASPSVTEALRGLRRTDGFRIRVPHPDGGEEFDVPTPHSA